ncbi:MAG: hypothetical protein RJA81_1805, partial [Planctomycetota bacterium]
MRIVSAVILCLIIQALPARGL